MVLDLVDFLAIEAHQALQGHPVLLVHPDPWVHLVPRVSKEQLVIVDSVGHLVREEILDHLDFQEVQVQREIQVQADHLVD